MPGVTTWGWRGGEACAGESGRHFKTCIPAGLAVTPCVGASRFAAGPTRASKRLAQLSYGVGGAAASAAMTSLYPWRPTLIGAQEA